MNLKILSLLLSFGLVACAQIPTKDGIEKTEESTEQIETKHANLPKQELTAPILFDFLLGETALQRGQLDIAVGRYLKLAKTTRDPRIAKRASEIALHARHPFVAEQATTLWVELEPESSEARQTLAALLVNLGKLDKARPHLEMLLATEKENVGQVLLQLNQLLAHNRNKVQTLQLIQHLAQPYKKLPEAHFAISQAAWFASRYNLAYDEMHQAFTLRPDWEIAAIQKGRILQRQSVDKATKFFETYLKKYPAANEVRIAYSRLLIAQGYNDLAGQQLKILQERNLDNADIMLAVGILSTELRDFNLTEISLKRALELDYKDPNAVNFQLAQIYEETKQTDKAMATYLLVTSGEQYIPAQIRYADLLALEGDLDKARSYLKSLPAANDQQTAHLILAEAQIIRRSGRHQEVFDILDAGLNKLPDFPELLYDRALAADKLGKFDITEKDLRKLIEIRPNNAHAYNALGYSLAERGDKLPEALKLIKHAVELSPDDPYIMDSLGWVYYRMGNLVDGLNYLNLAFASKPDAEIAAHLGEVLWIQGAQEDAKRIWQSALEENPGNTILLETMKRFMNE